ncbi:MAG: hypothetical protein AAB368_13135, partial [bacterium]
PAGTGGAVAAMAGKTPFGREMDRRGLNEADAKKKLALQAVEGYFPAMTGQFWLSLYRNAKAVEGKKESLGRKLIEPVVGGIKTVDIAEAKRSAAGSLRGEMRDLRDAMYGFRYKAAGMNPEQQKQMIEQFRRKRDEIREKSKSLNPK